MNVRCSLDLASACSNTTTDQQLPTLTAQSLHSERYNNKSRAQKKPGTGPAPSAWQRGRGSWLVLLSWCCIGGGGARQHILHRLARHGLEKALRNSAADDAAPAEGCLQYAGPSQHTL